MRDPEDRPRFASLMQGLAANFSHEPTSAWLEGQWMVLSELSIEALTKAIGAAMRSATFMPRAAELLKLAGADTVALRATRAWTTVVEAIRSHGYTGGLDARGDNGLTHAVVRAMGGWGMLCRCYSDELHSFKAKQFGELYEAMATATLTDKERRPLCGEYGGCMPMLIGGVDARSLPAVGGKELVRA